MKDSYFIVRNLVIDNMYGCVSSFKGCKSSLADGAQSLSSIVPPGNIFVVIRQSLK
jgi:hypothetical protein